MIIFLNNALIKIENIVSECKILSHCWQFSQCWQWSLTCWYNFFHQYSENIHQQIDFTFLWLIWSCRALTIFFCWLILFMTFFIFMFLLMCQNNFIFWTKYCKIFDLNLINFLSFMSANLLNIVRYLVICSCCFK